MKTRGYRNHMYEEAPEFNADAYKVSSYGGVAWGVLGWEVNATEDTDWDGIYERTGNLLAVMVGDDRVFSFEPDELEAISEEEFCGGCGQIGCGHGGR